MRKGLFRQQAMTHQASPIQGELLMTPKTSYMVITGVLVSWCICVSFYLATGNYQRTTTVTGWLEPTRGILRFYADNRKGKITQVFVSEGDYVEKGSPLLTINYGVQQAHGFSVETQLKQELLKQRDRLKASFARTVQIQADYHAQLVSQRLVAKADVASLEKINELSLKQWELANSRFNALKVLFHSGHVSEADFNSDQLNALNSQQAWRQTSRDLKRGKAEVSRLTHAISALPEEQANDRAAQENQLSELNQQLLTLEREHQQVLYASENGLISGLQARLGHVVDQSRPLLSLLPANATIEARLLVPVRAAGFITEGQQLDIRYDAFPYQKFGLQEGNIVSISKTILLPGEWANAPLTVNEPAYLVTANVKDDAIMAYGEPIPLKAGMTFSADVGLSQRTLIEWFLEPLTSVTKRLQ